MSQDWMIDVLTDIRVFAEKRMMFDLAEQLDDAVLIAAREIRAMSDASEVPSEHGQPDRRPLGETARH